MVQRKGAPTLSRLDRFLIFGEWEEKFPDAVQAVLTRVTSDHTPLVLDCEGMSKRKTPFKFENMWLRADDFKDRVRDWWEGCVVYGNPSFVLAAKLRALKGNIKKWNKEVYGNLEWRKNRMMSEIAELDRLEDSGGLGEEGRRRREVCKAEIHKIAISEEISWHQKSRAIWLKEGDRNSRFFHRLANAHRRNNHIGRIIVDGEVLSRTEEVGSGVSSFYQRLYTEEFSWRPQLDGLSFDRLPEEVREGLERPFSEKEVLVALKSCKADKAPGPDGFTSRFLLENWEVVKGEVMGTFHAFHSHCRFEKSLNASFIALIPKKGGATDVRDFRPISLVGCIYKLIAKVLASRLSSVMDGLISDPQSAFIGGCQILDSALILD